MNEISAQVSFYPRKQMDISPQISKVIEIFREHSLEVDPGPMTTLITGNDKNVFSALHHSFVFTASEGEIDIVAHISNAFTKSTIGEQLISMQVIGHVENDFDEVAHSHELKSIESRIILNPGFADGLSGLKPEQQIMVLFYFHRSIGYELLQHPRGDQNKPKRGVFSLRSPNRPNPIGVSEVRLLEIKLNILRVRGLDAINGTPVIDIKPA